MSIKELYKQFNLNSISTEDTEDTNQNILNSEKKQQNNYTLMDQDLKDDIFDDIDDDFLNLKDYKTIRYKSITSFNLSKNLEEEQSETNNNNRISLGIIKDIPKYSRIKTNRNDIYRYQEEDYNEIIKDFLYISSYKTASTVIDLKNLKITNIINCSGDLCENLSYESSLLNIEYLTLNVKDNVSENIECLFFICINYINHVKEKNGKILIHCYKGVSRSVSIVIAYLIYLYKWTYDEAFDFVQSKRSIANPNIGFYLQLKTFHKRLTLKNDRLEIFSVSHFSQEQYDLIVCRLIYNNISLKNNSQNNKRNEENEDNLNDIGDIGDKGNISSEKKDNNIFDDIDENKKENEDEKEEKKEIILNEKGMFIFAMKKNIFIVEGKNISDKNKNIYKKCAIDYIKEIKKFEKLGKDINENKIEVISQVDMELKYSEIINVNNIIINFNEKNNIDKLYVD